MAAEDVMAAEVMLLQVRSVQDAVPDETRDATLAAPEAVMVVHEIAPDALSVVVVMPPDAVMAVPEIVPVEFKDPTPAAP